MKIPEALHLFRNAAFARFWLARLLAMLGIQVQATAIGWQVYDLAREAGQSIAEAALLLGFIGLVQFIPLLFLSLIGGQAADRLDRKRIILACYIAKAAIAGCIAVIAGFEESIVIPAIFLAAALAGGLNAFLPAASQSLTPRLVSREELPRAIALMSLAFQSGAIIGPAIGGVVYALSPNAAYTAAAMLIALAATLIIFVRAPQHVALPAARTLAMIKEGILYIRANKIVLGAISLDFAVVLLAGATALLPVFARDILNAGPEGLGLLRSAMAIGAAGVAVALALRPLERHVGAWMFGSVIIFGFATIVFGLSTAMWLSMMALGVAGAADMISVYVRQSLIQLATPDAMRGRVSAVSFVFISASNELGEFESGVAARFLGAIPAVVLGGAGAIVIALFWMRWFGDLARADRFTDVQAKEAPGAITGAASPAL